MRRVLLGAILIGLLMFVVACGGGSDKESGGGKKDTLVVVDWGGAVTEARQTTLFEPFEEAFDVKIEVESPTDYGKLKAMVEGNNVTWDVVNVDTFWAQQAGEQGLMEEIDYDIVETDGIVEELVNDYAVGAEMYSAVIAYSTEEYDETNSPQTWEDFWDVEKFPGARALYNDPVETMEIALLADGVSQEELYPLDIDRAFDSLSKLESATEVVWWDAGAQPVELLSTGTVTMSAAWNGRITEAKKEDVPVDLTYNQAVLSSEAWSVPKGTKNKDLAMEFINFVTSAEIQAAFSEAIDYSPVNTEAVDQLSEEVQERLGQSPELAESQVVVDPTYWAEHYEEVAERLQEWHLEK